MPPGTTICDLKNQELVDLISDNHLFLKGGRGGKGNNHYKSSINQTPQQFQQGEQGQTAEVTLKMKLIADIGVIGFPNTGKSTLVSALTGAKTKIDNYPFTTLKPQLGILKKKNRVLTLADTPRNNSGSFSRSRDLVSVFSAILNAPRFLSICWIFPTFLIAISGMII